MQRLVEKHENRYFAGSTSATLTFSMSTKIILVQFNLAIKPGVLINMLGYQHSEPVKIVSGSVPVDTNQLCGNTDCGARNKIIMY